MNQDRIKEFLKRLESPEGCNFREKIKGDPKSTVWNCDGNFARSRKILMAMGIPIKEQDDFLEECKEFGGYCDCEILLNSAEHLR